jgi:hypothetical protein
MDFVTPCNSLRLFRLACGINKFRLCFGLFSDLIDTCVVFGFGTVYIEAVSIPGSTTLDDLGWPFKCHCCSVSPLSSQHGSILNSWDTEHPHLMEKSKLYFCRNPWILLSFI